MAFASFLSFSVTTSPASCVESSKLTVFHAFVHDGWWFIFSATSATFVMKPKASVKSLNLKVFFSRLFSSVHSIARIFNELVTIFLENPETQCLWGRDAKFCAFVASKRYNPFDRRC